MTNADSPTLGRTACVDTLSHFISSPKVQGYSKFHLNIAFMVERKTFISSPPGWFQKLVPSIRSLTFSGPTQRCSTQAKVCYRNVQQVHRGGREGGRVAVWVYCNTALCTDGLILSRIVLTQQ
jgi:hypothetical protein